jgi:hypothetical protein
MCHWMSLVVKRHYIMLHSHVSYDFGGLCSMGKALATVGTMAIIPAGFVRGLSRDGGLLDRQGQ